MKPTPLGQAEVMSARTLKRRQRFQSLRALAGANYWVNFCLFSDTDLCLVLSEFH